MREKYQEGSQTSVRGGAGNGLNLAPASEPARQPPADVSNSWPSRSYTRLGTFPQLTSCQRRIPGSRSRDIGYGFVDFRRPEGRAIEQWVRTCASGTGARAGHRRSGDPGLWVRNKEQWSDRRAMTADTRVRGPRRVSRSE